MSNTTTEQFARLENMELVIVLEDYGTCALVQDEDGKEFEVSSNRLDYV